MDEGTEIVTNKLSSEKTLDFDDLMKLEGGGRTKNAFREFLKN